MPTSPFDPIPQTLDEWLDYCSEWIAEGVYDVPAIETREDFKFSIRQALERCATAAREKGLAVPPSLPPAPALDPDLS